MNDSKNTLAKGVTVSSKFGIKETIIDFLKRAMDKKIFDAILIPIKVPAGDSFVYVLLNEKSLFKDAMPLPPIMSVQGAKAISSITRLGKGNLKIAAVMRPCEIRATNELAKLKQVDLENITLISMDCPGVLPTSYFLKDPEKMTMRFNEAAERQDDSIMRPVCQICDKSSMVAGDLHIGTLGAKKDTFFIISNSQKGDDVIHKLEMKLEDSINSWREAVKKYSQEKHIKRKKNLKSLKSKVGGLDNLIDTFSQCINCHNCMKACPICYCRLCYFDSDKVKHPSEEYLEMAEDKGTLRFLPDTILFHVGRMMHMSVSCVSCGSCEDACPMSIPVAQIFSMVADETQDLFGYVSGRDVNEPIPLTVYKEDEFHEVED